MRGPRRQVMVVAALIERGGKLLICQRRNDDRHAFKWEFPGGKVEAGETPRQALERELNGAPLAQAAARGQTNVARASRECPFLVVPESYLEMSALVRP